MDRRPLAAATLLLAMLAACGGEPDTTAPVSQDTAAAENAPALAAIEPLAYADPANWLCRPESEDACEQVSNATIVSADGTLEKETVTPHGEPLIDCFYVYPTVSRDEAGNADATPGPEELEIVRQQFARFAPVCRQFAPLYRQVTLTALYKLRRGEEIATDREMAYADVKAAWTHYLTHDNNGRGVVLVGHDQGAGLLTRLIAAEIDGQPARDRLVSAILPGGSIEIPEGLPAGGSFRTVPVCASADSTGCVIAWSAFRAETPPAEESIFATAGTTGMRAACVNPAELDGSAGQLKPALPVGTILFDELAPPAPWTADNTEIETPFVRLPGLLSARCITRGRFDYLAITVNADPADPRTDTISGDVVVDGEVRPLWGLHLIDMHLAMGNLVDIVARQAAAWTRQQSPAAALPEAFHPDP